MCRNIIYKVFVSSRVSPNRLWENFIGNVFPKFSLVSNINNTNLWPLSSFQTRQQTVRVDANPVDIRFGSSTLLVAQPAVASRSQSLFTVNLTPLSASATRMRALTQRPNKHQHQHQQTDQPSPHIPQPERERNMWANTTTRHLMCRCCLSK